MRRLMIIMLACAACDASSPVGSSKKEAPRAIALDPPSDDAIERRLVEIYSQVDGLQDVRVDVTAGVVKLAGETDTVAFELRAGQLASRTEGVVHVSNRINQRNTTRLAVATWHTVRRAGMTIARETPHVLAAFIVFLPFLLLFIALRRWRPLRILGMKSRTESIIRFIMRAVTLITGLILAIDVLGIMGILGTLVGALGIAGVIAGFAFKDWLGNYLPGLILGLHPQFRAGDLIRVNSWEGRVIRISPRATVIMTVNGEELRIPNSVLYRETLINFSNRPERRLRFTLPLAPSADLGTAEEVGCRALLALRGVLADPPPFMRIKEIESEIVHLEFFAWVDQAVDNFRTVESHAKRAVLEALIESKLPLPENSMLIRFRHQRQAARHGQDIANEDRDRAFLEERLETARAERDEADLLRSVRE